MKKFSVSVLASSFVASTLWAQAAEDATTTATAVKGLEFKGAVESGERSHLTGDISGDDQANTVGAYITPNFNLSYSNPSVSITTGYQLEAFGGRGFGEAFEGSRDFQDNTYFQHYPTLNIVGTLDPNWTMTAYAEYLYTIHSGSEADNLGELVLEPSISRKIGSRFTLGIAYQYYRKEGFDAAGTDLGDLDLSAGRAAVNAAITNALVDPVTQRHVAKVSASAKMSDALTLKGYVHSGRQYANRGGNDATVYRINTDIVTSAIENLELQVRYRFNINDNDGDAAASWYHLGGIYATLNMTDALGITLSNEGVILQGTGAPTTYENENYLGLSYSF